MNTRLLKLGAAIGGLALAVTMTGAGAASAATKGQGASVQHDPYGGGMYCIFADQNGFLWKMIDCDAHIVTTPKGRINETVTGTLAPWVTAPTTTVRFRSGQLCDRISGARTMLSGSLSPSGHFTAKCTN